MGKDDEPRNSGEQSYRLEDLLRMLREGQLPSGGRGFSVFNVNSTPRLSGGASMSPGGFPETDFGEKFQGDFRGWQHGERVRTKYIVEKRKDKTGKTEFVLRVSESVAGEFGHTDVFFLEGLTDSDKKALALVGIADLEAVVQVDKRVNTQRQLDNIQEYTARLDRVIAIQKPWNGDTKELEEGQSVLVEGEVVVYKQDCDAQMQIKLKNGKVIHVKLWNGYIEIEDGVIEKFAPAYPVPGDIVQVATTYGNPDERYGKKSPVCLFACYCRSTYLLRPQPERSDSNKMQRRHVSTEIARIKKAHDSKEIRSIVSELVNSSIVDGKLNITEDEQRRINEAIALRIKDDKEKPMELFADFGGNKDLCRGYRIDVFGISRGEYYDFCMRVARGEIRMLGNGSSDAPLRLMGENITKSQEAEILTTLIISFYSRVVGKNTIRGKMLKTGIREYNPAELADPGNATWEDVYLFHQALGYYSSHTTSRAAELYLHLAKNMLDKRLFKKGEKDRLIEYSESEIVSAMTRNVTDNIIWKDNKWGTEIMGFKDAEALRKYINQIKIIKNLLSILKNEGWKNGGQRDPERDVEKLIRLLEKIDMILRSSSAHLN